MAYRANNATVVELVDKQLGHTLVHQLLQTLLELLRLHRVVVFNILEQFGGERGETTEVEHVAFGECVSDLEDTIVRQTHDIARPRLLYRTLALRHKLCGRGETHRLVQSDVAVGLVAHEATRANLAEGDA